MAKTILSSSVDLHTDIPRYSKDNIIIVSLSSYGHREVNYIIFTTFTHVADHEVQYVDTGHATITVDNRCKIRLTHMTEKIAVHLYLGECLCVFLSSFLEAVIFYRK
jgi:hypothetical protein